MPRPVSRRSQQGIALVVVLMMTALLVMFIGLGMRLTINSMQDSNKQFQRQAQASNIARAGLQDAIGWFKRQSTQPVRNNVASPPYSCSTNPSVAADMAFNPLSNADPLLSDTDDATIGLVKDIRLSGSLYGRYVVKRQGCSTTVDPHAAHDYSEEKGKGANGDGLIWYMESQGILYQRNSWSKTNGKFNDGPDQGGNIILQKSSAAVEIQRLKIDPRPFPISLSKASGSASSSNVNSRCNIMADQTGTSGGVYTYNATVNGSATCSLPTTGACVPAAPAPQAHQSVDLVFGVTQVELKALADYIYSNVSNIPKKLAPGIHYLEGGGTGTFTFNSSKPLTGSGVLFVNGNLTLSDGASSSFNGVVYVTGTLTVGNGNSLGGATVAQSLQCSPGNGVAVIEYSSKVVQQIKNTLGLYRENALTFRISDN